MSTPLNVQTQTPLRLDEAGFAGAVAGCVDGVARGDFDDVAEGPADGAADGDNNGDDGDDESAGAVGTPAAGWADGACPHPATATTTVIAMTADAWRDVRDTRLDRMAGRVTWRVPTHHRWREPTR